MSKENNKKKTNKAKTSVTADGLVTAPIRRFAARAFDYVLYLEILNWILALAGTNTNSALVVLGLPIVTAAVMFCLEPLLLWKLGTTPGKALLGLSVAQKNGKKLRYADGIARMDGVMSQGMGWFLPVWSLIQLWKSFRRGSGGKLQPWDKVAPVRQKGDLKKRAALFAVACVLLSCVDVAVMYSAELPRNRGELTVEEFAENFNRQAGIWSLYYLPKLDKNGEWETDGDAAGVPQNRVPFQYTLEDGVLKTVTFAASREGKEEPFLSLPGGQSIAAVSAVVWAQKNGLPGHQERMDLLDEILERGLDNYTLEQAGVTISCRTEAEGFLLEDGKLNPQEGAERYFAAFTFTIELPN